MTTTNMMKTGRLNSVIRNMCVIGVMMGGVAAQSLAGDEPCLLSSFSIPAHSSQMTVVDDRLYVALGGAGMQIFDISDTSSPQLLGTYNGNGGAKDVVVINEVAFIAALGGGLRIVDVSTPSSPVLIGFNQIFQRRFHHIQVAGGIAYLTETTYGVFLFDISDLNHPFLKAVMNPWGNGGADKIALAGSYAYTTVGTRLDIIDVTDSNSPVQVGQLDTGMSMDAVMVRENIAYVTSNVNGLHIIDVSNPASPSLLATYDTPGEAREIVVVGDRAYVEDRHGGLLILDISNPAFPSTVGWYGMSASRALTVVDGVAYVGEALQNVFILDLAGSCGEPCVADLNGDGALDFSDISMFLDAYGTGGSIADFNGDGMFDFFDISAFITAFVSGCP